MYKYIFFILLSLNVYSQEKASIRFFPSDCREEKSPEEKYYKYAWWTKKVTIKNNSGYNETVVKKPGENLEVKNLEKGTYTIIYESMFAKVIEMSFEVEEYKKYEVDLCTNIIDYSIEPFKPRISQLKNNESFIINFYSQGCFHSDEKVLTISRKRKKYFIEYEGKLKQLSKEELKMIAHFEIELSHAQEGGCTTTETYHIQFRNKKDIYYDGTCSWDGLHYLMKNLEIVNYKDY